MKKVIAAVLGILCLVIGYKAGAMETAKEMPTEVSLDRMEDDVAVINVTVNGNTNRYAVVIPGKSTVESVIGTTDDYGATLHESNGDWYMEDMPEFPDGTLVEMFYDTMGTDNDLDDDTPIKVVPLERVEDAVTETKSDVVVRDGYIYGYDKDGVCFINTTDKWSFRYTPSENEKLENGTEVSVLFRANDIDTDVDDEILYVVAKGE